MTSLHYWEHKQPLKDKGDYRFFTIEYCPDIVFSKKVKALPNKTLNFHDVDDIRAYLRSLVKERGGQHRVQKFTKIRDGLKVVLVDNLPYREKLENVDFDKNYCVLMLEDEYGEYNL